MFFFLLDTLCVIAVMAVLWTQVIVPIRKGINIFPYFNDKLNEVQTRLVIERENLEIATLQKEADELRKRTEAITTKN